MPSRAYTSFLPSKILRAIDLIREVSMPSRAYTSFLLAEAFKCQSPFADQCVNALSGLYLISTSDKVVWKKLRKQCKCQCPLGLIPHFYLPGDNRDHKLTAVHYCVNALSGLYLISTSQSMDTLDEVT